MIMSEEQSKVIMDVCIKLLSDEQTEVARVSMGILAGEFTCILHKQICINNIFCV